MLEKIEYLGDKRAISRKMFEKIEQLERRTFKLEELLEKIEHLGALGRRLGVRCSKESNISPRSGHIR